MEFSAVEVQPPDLFGTPGVAVDLVYRNIRDGASHRLKASRAFAEALWQDFHPLADSHFVSEFSRNCYSRFWEMYLGCTFLDAGHRPFSTAAGPDLSITTDFSTIRIEAIAPSNGAASHPDTVPLIVDGVVQSVPVEKVLLRYRAALEEKHRKYKDYLNAGSLTPADPYVIAVNGSNVRFAGWIDEPPIGMQAVFPLGDLTVTFSKDPEVDEEAFFAHRSAVTKSSGATVLTNIFLEPRYSEISAAIFSHVDPANHPERLGDDFVLIHNPSAKNPLPMGFLPRGREFVARQSGDEYHVTSHDWR